MFAIMLAFTIGQSVSTPPAIQPAPHAAFQGMTCSAPRPLTTDRYQTVRVCEVSK